MISVPKTYITKIILPLLRRFENEPTAIELAFSVSISVSHIVDVISCHESRRPGNVRKELTAMDRNFEVIQAFAIAAKHVTVTDNRHGKYVGLRSDDAQVAIGAAFSDGTYFSDGSSFSDNPDVIRVKTPDGEWYDMLFVARSVVNHLESKYC